MSYTANDVKTLSATAGIGLNEAKLRLDKIDLLVQVSNAKSLEELKPVLLFLIDKL